MFWQRRQPFRRHAARGVPLQEGDANAIVRKAQEMARQGADADKVLDQIAGDVADSLDGYGKLGNYSHNQILSAAKDLQNLAGQGMMNGGGNDFVTYHRIQGGEGTKSSRQRILVGKDGKIAIPDKETQLYVSIDNGEHANYFSSKRPSSHKVEFDVPSWFDDLVKENAIPQYGARQNPRYQNGMAPIITDLSTPGTSIGLPDPWIKWLEEYANNARIIGR